MTENEDGSPITTVGKQVKSRFSLSIQMALALHRALHSKDKRGLICFQEMKQGSVIIFFSFTQHLRLI